MNDKVFKTVPEYPWLSAAADGEILNQLTGEKSYGDTQERVPNTQYPSAFSYTVHRLVAMAWLDRPESGIEGLTVNHKDGIKRNNFKDNLEWASYSENTTHAYETGLRKDNTPILVKDLRTDEIRRYYSLQECARAFNKNGSLIYQYLKNSSIIRFEYYVFIREGQQWPPLTREHLGMDYKNKPRPMIATSLETGDQVLASSIAHMAVVLGIEKSKLFYHVGKYKDKPYHGYVFEEVTDPEIRERLMLARWKAVGPVTSRRKPTPVVVKDTVTGEVSEWISVEEFAKSQGTTKNTVQKSMLRLDGMWRQFRIEYSPTQQ